MNARARHAALATTLLVFAGVIVSGYWNVDEAHAVGGDMNDPGAASAAAFEHWVGEFGQADDEAELRHYADWVRDQVGVPADRENPDGYLMAELDMVWLYLTHDEAARANGLVGQNGLDAAETTSTVSLPTPVEGGGPWVAPGQRGVEIVPVGISRIGTPVDEWRGSGPSTGGVRVAIVDTGIDGRHDDLNVAGGFNCSQDARGPEGYDIDLHGHGTHVAGTIGAIHNDSDVVGVAPGVALYSEAVFSTGSASGAMVLCGLNHALVDGADVISASLGGEHLATRCGGPSVYVNAWCKAAKRAVVVVAAGNDAVDAIFKAPANVDAAGLVTVGAFIDYDGLPGEHGRGYPGCGYLHRDDYLAVFSNFGTVVDVVAPGGCVESLMPGQMTAWMSGTSMATPHVTGVFAAFMGEFPDCRGEDAVRTVLNYARIWARDHPEDGYSGWPGADPPPIIRWVDEEPLRIQPLPPAEPTPCAFEEVTP